MFICSVTRVLLPVHILPCRALLCKQKSVAEKSIPWPGLRSRFKANFVLFVTPQFSQIFLHFDTLKCVFVKWLRGNILLESVLLNRTFGKHFCNNIYLDVDSVHFQLSHDDIIRNRVVNTTCLRAYGTGDIFVFNVSRLSAGCTLNSVVCVCGPACLEVKHDKQFCNKEGLIKLIRFL